MNPQADAGRHPPASAVKLQPGIRHSADLKSLQVTASPADGRVKLPAAKFVLFLFLSFFANCEEDLRFVFISAK